MQKNIRILPFYSYFLLIIAWEQRKFFESIASTIDFRGRTPKKLGMDWSDSGYLALSALNVKNGYIDPLADAHYGDEKLYRKWMSGRELKKGQVLFTTEAPMGNVAQVPDDNGYILSQRTVAFETKEDMMTNDFLAVLLKSPLVFNNLSALSSGGTAKGVSQKSLKGLSITVPLDIDEQQKIGSFFKQLDETIALHQRKLDKLKLLKQVYLQQFFPQYDEKIPKVRFANFTDEWEQRNVGNFLSESKVKGSDGSIAKKITVKLWRKGIVPKNNMFKGSSATQYYIRSAGQFMYGKLDFLNQSFGILPAELNGYESTLDSPAFDFKNGIDPIFFLENVCQENFYKYQGNIANGSRKAKRIHSDTFFDMPIIIPNFEEQQKVGSFFKELDTTIALHQSKLGKLKSLKQVLLQKMFN
ncbi:restriction endonuclease subunit S [Lactococcus carnosus]|uniref:restriction endonuclease subunit S n=1 Tax=Pseudolactococcus carnosus TaxID=2749961 RepID=UPI001FBB6831|nr:restriction endonuclease subunit S [Lactococcus carnosus]MCJ2001556.1 restriction endonuclease subunit S [Lactococcus carnosus]